MDDNSTMESSLDTFYVVLLDTIIEQVAQRGVAVVHVNDKPVGLFKGKHVDKDEEAGEDSADIIPFPSPPSDTKH